MQPVTKQTILITGATDGLGRALAMDLAAAGAAVLIHGRDDARGRSTIAEIRARTGNDRLHWLRADLSGLDEVRHVAEQVIRDHGRLDALVNNAGIGTTVDGDRRRMESRDGYELRFAVNYLAGYLLIWTSLSRGRRPDAMTCAPFTSGASWSWKRGCSRR